MSEELAQFELHRRYLIGIAYRMLGSVAEAEDAVQDAFLRWERCDRSSIEEPRAFLAQTVTRLCLDRLKACAHTREQYVGTWLPEPFVETADAERLANDVSVALLVTLERLTPLERAAFLLHDVFDMDYSAVASTLTRSEAACRQLAARAREHVQKEQPRFKPSPDAEARLTGAFAAAMASGDVASLGALLAEDAVFYTDGGGKRTAALKPIYGRERILRFVAGVSKKHAPLESARMVRINGLPGFVLSSTEGLETIAIETSGEYIVAIYGIRNPDKLRHVS